MAARPTSTVGVGTRMEASPLIVALMELAIEAALLVVAVLNNEATLGV